MLGTGRGTKGKAADGLKQSHCCISNAQAVAPQLVGEAPQGVVAGDQREEEEQGEGSGSEGEEEGWEVVCRSRRRQ